jgi:ankyrin repeat protein
MGRESRHLNRALLDAVMMRNTDEIRKWLEAGANVNAKDSEHDEAAILLAAKHANAEIVELLIDEGADVEARNDVGRTALFFAGADSETFARLLAAGANIHARDHEGNTLLMRAVSKSASLVEVDELLRLGIEPGLRNSAGESALDMAVNLGLVRIIERLKSSEG